MELEVKNREQKRVIISKKEVKMRIALCDINNVLIQNIKKMIYTYAEQNRLDILVDCYCYGEQLFRCEQKYNIIFLGYELAGTNGFQTALRLREVNSFSSIVFISANTEFVFESFKASPYRFLVPPISSKDIYTLLDDFFKKFGTDYPLLIRSQSDVVCLNTGDISFLEADNKHCYIHTKSEALLCNKTMAKVFEVLPKNHFIKINRAFIVNLNYVSRYNNEEVILTNGEKLHISRKYMRDFKSEYHFFKGSILL